MGGTAIVDGSDVSNWEAAGGLIDKTVSTFGRLDGLVNNAGVLAAVVNTSSASGLYSAIGQGNYGADMREMPHARRLTERHRTKTQTRYLQTAAAEITHIHDVPL